MATKNNKTMTVFEQIQEGLNESIAHARGQLNLRTTTLPLPAPALSKTRVIAIRKKTGMSQALFAGYLNVPTKTLQSWEQGVRRPKAGEARLLQIFETNPTQVGQIIQTSGPSTRTLSQHTNRGGWRGSGRTKMKPTTPRSSQKSPRLGKSRTLVDG